MDIFMILYDLCLLPAKFYVIMHIEKVANHVQTADRCATWKISNDAGNLVLQALQFQEVGVCHEFPAGASIGHY
jgi:hypothetical protein